MYIISPNSDLTGNVYGICYGICEDNLINEAHKKTKGGVQVMAKGSRSKEPGKTVIRRTIIEEAPAGEASHGPNWFSKNPLASIGLGLLALIVLFVPLFPSTKTVQTTETVMVPMSTEMTVPGTTVNKTIKTYTGYMWDDRGTPYSIDAVAGIVDIRRARGPDNTWVISTIDNYGTENIYRDIVRDDLTKTGSTTVPVSTDPGTKTGTQMVPQQVTKDKEVPTRVSLVQLMFGGN
jgi:hypothetical protein